MNISHNLAQGLNEKKKSQVMVNKPIAQTELGLNIEHRIKKEDDKKKRIKNQELQRWKMIWM